MSASPTSTPPAAAVPAPAEPPALLEEERPGEWYENYCRRLGALGRRLGSPEQRQVRLKKALEKIQDRQAALQDQVRALAARPGNEAQIERLQARQDHLDRVIRLQKEGYERTRFKRELTFAGLRLSPDEVHYSALWTLLLSFLGLTGLLIFLLVWTGFLLSISILIIVMVVLFVPLTLYLFLYNYPGMLGKRLRVRTLGRAPEAIHYMAMSLRLNPSLPQAVEMAAKNTEGPLGEAFQKMLWDVSQRQSATVEDAFQGFAMEWGHWNEEFMRALYALRLSVMEDTKEGRVRSLEKAQEIILSGTRRRVEDFASRLGGPTTILFGLGILLPLVVGAMLPMVFLANLGTAFGGAAAPAAGAGAAASTTSTASSSSGPQWVTLAGFVLAMDIALPLVALVYSIQIVSKRPGTTTPPIPARKQGRLTPARAALIGVVAGVGAGSLAVPAYLGDFGATFQLVWSVLLVLGVGVGVSVAAQLWFSPLERRRKAFQKMEAEFPDVLFQIASRMSEGAPLVQAIQITAESMEDTETARFLSRFLHVVRVSGMTPEQALFGEGATLGLLHEIPSRQVRVAFRALLDADQKGPESVVQTILPMAEHLKEMQATDDRIRAQLQGTVQMMNGTAFFFAPMTMGMTGALYLLLAGVLTTGALPVAPFVFFLVMGVYLLEIGFIALNFAVGIEHGGDRTLFWSTLGNFLWLSSVLFVAASVGGIFFLNGSG